MPPEFLVHDCFLSVRCNSKCETSSTSKFCDGSPVTSVMHIMLLFSKTDLSSLDFSLCMHARTHARTFARTNVHTHARTRYRQTDRELTRHTYIHACMHAHPHACTYVRTHTYIHTEKRKNERTDRLTDGHTGRQTYTVLISYFLVLIS